MTTNISSTQVRVAFRAAGLSVRVRDLGEKFRICNVAKCNHSELCATITAGLGMTDILGKSGGSWNGSAEFISYKPGVVVVRAEAETDEWTKALNRMYRRSEAQMRKEKMPDTKEECLRMIEAETAKCYFHSHGWNPPYRCRLLAHAKKMGWV